MIMMRWISVFLMTSMLFVGTVHAKEAAQTSRDPRLANAYESYRKGVRDEARGDKTFRGRSGKAQRMYEHAEAYYLDAAFRYEQLSIKYNIDLKKEIAMCNKSHRAVHVKTNDARNIARGR
jgi:hypothetical protein